MSEQQQLSQELKIGISNAKRLRCIWRKTMKEMKIPELRMNVIVTRGTFDRALDIQDYCGNLLVECLNQCEEQHQKNVNHHMDIVKKFERIYGSRLEAASNFYDYNLGELIEETNSELKIIDFLQYDDEIFLETLIFQGKTQLNDILDSLNSDNFYKLENLQNTSNNMTEIAMVHLAENISSTWESLNAELSKYLKEQTRDKLQLNLLTSQHNSTMKHLEKIKEKSFKVLFLIQSCQKLQLNQEKLYPIEVNQVEDNFDYCEFLWYRVALANTIMYEYQCEKKQLQEENKYLQECVKKRMNEYSS
ncbi:uncharacterized protein [Chelonus insularis]|uniref:uncharacterized protein n=1 Tax=Chelonus insularis TaxID=460826 RepID=UPI00158B9A6B|nr:uncharacterized protein LOC118067585 [Chelonus insularis]